MIVPFLLMFVFGFFGGFTQRAVFRSMLGGPRPGLASAALFPAVFAILWLTMREWLFAADCAAVAVGAAVGAILFDRQRSRRDKEAAQAKDEADASAKPRSGM